MHKKSHENGDEHEDTQREKKCSMLNALHENNITTNLSIQLQMVKLIHPPREKQCVKLVDEMSDPECKM